MAKKTAAAAEEDNRTMLLDVCFVCGSRSIWFVRAVLVSPNKSILGQVENYEVEKI